MNLFQKFAPTVMSGVVFHLTMRQAGDLMQVELIPECDAGKTGIVIPPRALLATPEELDEKMPAFLDLYLQSTGSIQQQIEDTKSVMKEAEAAAQETTRKAAEPKGGTKALPAPRGSSSGKPASQKRDMNAGLGDLDDETGPDAAGSGHAADPSGSSGGEGEATSAASPTAGNLFV